jgi:predicted nucleic acid-binding protein
VCEKIVKIIDSSTLAKYANKEQNWEEIEKQLAGEKCFTLEFAMHEVGNSIWKRVLKKEIPKNDAFSVYREFVQAVFDGGIVELIPVDQGLLNESLELAIQESLTMYDSVFIELAHRNKSGLVTSDATQSDASKKHYPNMTVVLTR